MSRPLHIATSPLTGTVFVGSVLKDGRTWASNKTDVTAAACAAVAEHALFNGGKVEVSGNGVPMYEIVVKRIES